MGSVSPDLANECFVVAAIGETDSETRKRADQVLKYVIEPAAQDAGLVSIRADLIAQPGTISLQVIDHVVRAGALVADLTGQNPNVFYEVGIRHAFARPAILIAEIGSTLPFDIGHERTIFLDHRDLSSANSCRRLITAQLREALEGDVYSPVATAVDIQALRVGSPLEQQVARLVDEYQSITNSQRHILEILSDLGPRYLYSTLSALPTTDIAPYLRALSGNLTRLHNELLGAAGVDREMIDAIFRDSYRVVHNLQLIVDEAEGATRSAELAAMGMEELGSPEHDQGD